MNEAEALKAYQSGNNSGQGFAPYPDLTTVKSVVEAYISDGWMIVLPRTKDDEVAVVQGVSGEYIAIGDANGPWAVAI
jgi:hypothetical protein